jgi:hypothetical protein
MFELQIHHASLAEQMPDAMALWRKAIKEDQFGCGSLLVSREALSCAIVVAFVGNILDSSLAQI